MKHKPYFPNTNADRRAWLANFKTNIAIDGPGLGYSASKITILQDMCDTMIAGIDAADAAKAAAKSKNSDKDTLIKDGMEAMRKEVQTIKANSSYTEATGNSLGIIGSEEIIDYSTAKTTLKLVATPLGIEVKFGLEHCEAADIFSKRKADDAFVFQKRIMHPPYLDKRLNAEINIPELRQYYVVLVMDDEQVGIPSDIASIKI